MTAMGYQHYRCHGWCDDDEDEDDGDDNGDGDSAYDHSCLCRFSSYQMVMYLLHLGNHSGFHAAAEYSYPGRQVNVRVPDHHEVMMTCRHDFCRFHLGSSTLVQCKPWTLHHK